ncbi:diguanylate cyclase [Alcanivorax sp. JB21]|uniref:diguanylate cyclase domain-containing protein n=1 Tax=Alcanivorax limicola TaxID=2874102 RepID=UPI001CBB59AA|nr:diguanylate cyclase [Alcanivorax limicola]MBZ2190552.1 diguanylate cyclase [Alcanivorax limicola]
MSRTDPESLSESPAALVASVAVLFVESNGDAARLVEVALHSAGEGRFQVERVATLAGALERLARGDIEVVLIGTNLPCCLGADVFKPLRLAAPDALVLPLGEAGTPSAWSHDKNGGCAESAIDLSWLLGALDYVARRKVAEAAWRRADEALFEEKERARVTLGSIGDAVLVTDIQGNVTYLNQVAENLTGWGSAAAIGKALPDVFNITNSKTGKRARNPALHAMAENATVGLAANCVLHHLDGSETGIEDSAAPVYDRHGEVTGAVIVFRDVNQSRAVTRKMAWLGSHDSLTGLANRVLLEERFKQVVSLANRNARQAAMLFVDMDNFKQINDVLGHRVGDHVLQAVAGRLLRGVRDTDTVCRHGGDEFVILLADVASPAATEQVVTKLLALFSEPLPINGHKVKVAMSIGISMYPADGKDMHALIGHADVAMYQAKAQGANTFGFCAASL